MNKKLVPKSGSLIRTALRTGPNCLRHLALPYREEYNIRRHAPIYCGLYVTFRCNLSCPWCLVPNMPGNHNKAHYEADPESVERLINHPLFRSVAYINLTGGEPLLNERIFEIVRFLHRRGYMTGIVTNGLLLEDRVGELKEAGLDDIRISIYRNTVDKLSDVLPRLANRIMVANSYIILRSELHDNPQAIENVIRLSHDSGCVATRINFYIPATDKDLDEVVYEDDPALADLKQRLADKHPNYKIYWRPATKRRVEGPQDKTCRQLWETFHVDIQGNLGLCCKFCGTFDASGGNLFKDETGDLFNSDAVRKMRAGLLTRDDRIPPECSKCLYLGSSSAVAKAIASPIPAMIRNSLSSLAALLLTLPTKILTGPTAQWAEELLELA